MTGSVSIASRRGANHLVWGSQLFMQGVTPTHTPRHSAFRSELSQHREFGRTIFAQDSPGPHQVIEEPVTPEEPLARGLDYEDDPSIIDEQYDEAKFGFFQSPALEDVIQPLPPIAPWLSTDFDYLSSLGIEDDGIFYDYSQGVISDDVVVDLIYPWLSINADYLSTLDIDDYTTIYDFVHGVVLDVVIDYTPQSWLSESIDEVYDDTYYDFAQGAIQEIVVAEYIIQPWLSLDIDQIDDIVAHDLTQGVISDDLAVPGVSIYRPTWRPRRRS